MLDGAQSAPHMPVNVEDLDCEFYTFSAHKMGGPTGVGVLYGKKKWLEQLPPLEGGADMAKKVSFEKTEYQDAPKKFEAGTMSFADIIAFGDLIDFLQDLGMESLFEYEKQLLSYATKQLLQFDELTVVGKAPNKGAVISFHLGGNDVKDMEKYLNDEHNIFVKAGDLNAQPLMKLLGVKGLLRVSFSFYNTVSEIDVFINALKKYFKK
jgi:cysteine desulfurase/selenocysteine lyase